MSSNTSNIVFESVLSYYSYRWTIYERKWIQLTDNKKIIIMTRKQNGRIIKEIRTSFKVIQLLILERQVKTGFSRKLTSFDLQAIPLGSYTENY